MRFKQSFSVGVVKILLSVFFSATLFFVFVKVQAANAPLPSQCQLQGLTGASCCNSYPQDPVCTGSVTTNNSGTAVSCPPSLQNVNGVCLPQNPYGSGSLAGSTDLMGLVTIVLKALLFLSGIVAVIAIIIGGYLYMTSGGNEEAAEKGKKVLLNAIFGLILVILAYVIVSVITTSLTGNIANTSGQSPSAIDKLMQ